MKNISQYTAIFLACVLCAAFIGCEKENVEDSSAPVVTEESETTAAPTETGETEAEVDQIEATTEKAPVTTAEPTAAAEPQSGYTSGYEAAKAYYNAYLNMDAEAVYDMFCPEEISAYDAFLEENDYLDGRNARSVLKKSVIIGAIDDSMLGIKDIMAEYSEYENDVWNVTLVEDDLTEISEEELAEFNDSLGTSFTSAMDCGYVFYINESAEQSFVGNGCAFVEYEGRWYLSYSTVMNAELITYLDIF